MSDFLQFVIARGSDEPITHDEILQWAGTRDNWHFYNSTALQIAKMFDRGELTYEFCDNVMNDLWDAVLAGLSLRNNQLPEPFYEIYEAFDAGEYHRTEDRSDDPIADFTIPLITAFLTRNSR